MLQRLTVPGSTSAPEKPLPITHGEYSNYVNVLFGLLKALGIQRRQKPMRRLHEHMNIARGFATCSRPCAHF
jgi:hypothetical protein